MILSLNLKKNEKKFSRASLDKNGRFGVFFGKNTPQSFMG
jgi:hypothetical protein